MDFFEKLNKKATEAYKATKERASTLSEELRIKGRINETKEKVESLYIEIGKTVYTELKDGKTVAEEEILKKCDEISQNNDEISKLKDRLLNIRKLRTCVQCGEKISKDDLYCPKCGKEQPKEENVKVEEKEPENAKDVEDVEINDVDENKDVNENNDE